jgi:hypothetical protein
MPAESKKQQRFFGMVHAVQKGELSSSKVGPAVRKAARNTEYSDAKDFASTKHKNLPEKKGSVQMKYFEKQAYSDDRYENILIANRAYRERNLFKSSDEYKKVLKKQQEENPAKSNKWQKEYGKAGITHGAAAGATLAGIQAISKRVKGLKPLAGLLAKGTAAGAAIGGLGGLAIGGVRDESTEFDIMLENAEKAQKKYLGSKGIGVKYDSEGRSNFRSSPKARKKYFTEYDRAKIKANI